jgi:hypothetical protein
VRIQRVVLEHHRDVPIPRCEIVHDVVADPDDALGDVLKLATIRNAVDFPEPEGPTRIMNSPSAIARFMSLTSSALSA